MRELAKVSMEDEALHQLLKERLPAWVRPYLLVSTNLNDLNSLAEIADRLVLNMGSSSVYAVHNRDHIQTAGPSKLDQQILELKMTLKSCQQEINNLQLSQQQITKQLTEVQYQQQQHQLAINNLTQRSSRSDSGYRGHQPRGRSVTPNRNGYCTTVRPIMQIHPHHN